MSSVPIWLAITAAVLSYTLVGCVQKPKETLSANTGSNRSSSRGAVVSDADDSPESKEAKDANPIYERLRADHISHAEFQDIRWTILEMVENDSDQKEALAEQMRREQNPDLKICLLQIIGDTRDGFYEADLRHVITTETDVRILQTAAVVLGKLETPMKLEVLLPLLTHESANVRLGAVWGLKNVPPSPRAVEQLMNVLDDDEPVRCWWPSPGAGGYTVGNEAAEAIDTITQESLHGDKKLIKEWITLHRE